MPSYDSYIVERDYRLLDSDNHLLIPTKGIQLLITAADVLHSWSVPAITIKADAVPGRVNKVDAAAKRPGLFFGQCREICGRNHSFMPITVERFSFNFGYFFERSIKNS